jgi:hypothetical protein
MDWQQMMTLMMTMTATTMMIDEEAVDVEAG